MLSHTKIPLLRLVMVVLNKLRTCWEVSLTSVYLWECVVVLMDGLSSERTVGLWLWVVLYEGNIAVVERWLSYKTHLLAR
jgi:hypothetical protein